MKPVSLTPVLSLALGLGIAAACSSDPPEQFGGGGGASAAGTPASSGGPGSAGSSPAGGVATGGNAATGGANAAGSSAQSGGSAGNGGSGGGSSSAGSGGVTTGGGGSGGAGPCETVDCVAGIKNADQDALTSAFMLFGCYSKAGQDCITNPAGQQCPNQGGNLPFEQQGISTRQVFKLGGVAGKKYKLTIVVNGIVEAKYYSGGTRAAGDNDPPNPDVATGTDTFYTGGTPVNFESYNVYKIETRDAADKELQHYYLNSFPKTNIEYEHHQTFPIAFTHDIEVVGGGTVVLYAADRNCHAIDNCGAGYRTTSCADSDGRVVPNEPNLTLPASFQGKALSQLNLYGGNKQPFHSQVLHLVVKAVTAL